MCSLAKIRLEVWTRANRLQKPVLKNRQISRESVYLIAEDLNDCFDTNVIKTVREVATDSLAKNSGKF